MAYQPLSPEQFQKAKDAGFSTDKIIQMEQMRKQKDSATNAPQQPQQNLGQKILGNAGMAAKQTGEAALKMGNEAAFSLPAIGTQLATGGKFTGSPYPLVKGGINPFEGKDLSSEQGMMASGGAMIVPTAPVEAILHKALSSAFGTGTQAVKDITHYFGLRKDMGEAAKEVGAAIPTKEAIIRKSGEIKSSKVEPLSKEIDKSDASYKSVKDSVDKELGNLPDVKKEELRLTKLSQDEHKKNVLDVAKAHAKELEDSLKGKAEDVVKYLKDAIPERIKDINKAFGAHIDSISEAMDKLGVGIQHSDVHGILDATKSEAESLGINSGRMKEVLDKWHGRLSKEMEGTSSSHFDYATGQNVVTKTPGIGAKTVPLRDFLFESREFRRMLSGPQLSGVKGLNDEQIVGALFNKNVNDFLSKSIPSYRAMQKEYSPVINAMKAARKIFKPGEVYDDAQGVNLLKKYALEGTSSKGVTAGKAQLVGDIQKSSNFGEGTGDITSEISSLGQKVKQARENIGNLSGNLREKFSNEIADIEKSYSNKTKQLKEQLKQSKNQSQLQKDSIQSKIDDIEREHSARVSEVSQTADEMSALREKAKPAGWLLATAGLGGATEIGKKAITGRW